MAGLVKSFSKIKIAVEYIFKITAGYRLCWKLISYNKINFKKKLKML